MDDPHSSTHRQLLHIDLNLQTKELSNHPGHGSLCFYVGSHSSITVYCDCKPKLRPYLFKLCITL